jgi:FkbM family methyltransferase
MAALLPNKMCATWIHVDGTWMWIDATEIPDRGYALDSAAEQKELEFLLDALSANSTFVDAGANQGFYTLMISKHRPGTRVIAIEPETVSLHKLRQNVAANDLSNVIICPYALTDKEEQRPLMLNRSGNRGGNSLIVSQLRWQAIEEVETVRCRSLFSVLQENDVDRVDALKMDIEGYEYPVLRKFFYEAPEALYPKAIIVEAFGHLIQQTGGSPIELLIRAGYRLINHTDFNYFFNR